MSSYQRPDERSAVEREGQADENTMPSNINSPTVPRRVLFSKENTSLARMMNTPIPSRFVAGRRRRQYTYRTRIPAPSEEESDLRKRRLHNADRTDNPFEEVRKCCVRKKCFELVDKTYAFNWYRDLMAMKREQRKAVLITWYDRVHGSFLFDGRVVCWAFLRMAFGYSNDTLASVSNTGKARASPTSFAQPREIRCNTLRDSIITFLRITAQDCGDDMPHRNYKNLPLSKKKQVYEEYVRYFNSHDPLRFVKAPASIAYFYKIWKEFVKDVKTMKNIGFQKCAECVFYDEERAKNLHDPSALLKIKEAAKQHYQSMAEERRGYEMRKQQASREPQHYLSLVVDGADQSHYGLPHFLQNSKDDKGHKIVVKLVGVLMHGSENDLYLFSMVEGFESGANHIIESLHRALNMKKHKLGKLPATLFVQVDNCTRENKNRFFLGYLEMLVSRGVFVEVQMSSLEVGHTHTDVDQSFSCVHRRLDHNAAFSLTGLHEQLRKSYTPPPHVEELDRIANFSDHCQKSKVLKPVSQFTQYRYFRFLRESNVSHNGQYKIKCCVKRHVSEEWRQLVSTDGGFLTSCPTLTEFPSTKTKVLPNVRDVNACLRAAETRISNSYVMNELYALRDRVYTAREYQYHWDSAMFELHGDYTPEAIRTEMHLAERNDGGVNARLRYEVGDFVAVKPEASYNSTFWIAEVVGFANSDGEGYPEVLEILWYTAGAGEDPLTVTYKPGGSNGAPWIAQIHVNTVMLRFDRLTRRNRLSRETAIKLSRSLGTAVPSASRA